MTFVPNFAPSRASGWNAIVPYLATQQAFDRTASPIYYKATSTAVSPGAGSHVSIYFDTVAIAGKSYTFTVPVNVITKPAKGQALYLVWTAADGSGLGEWMGTPVTSTGQATLTLTDVAPAGASGLRCVIGNGGPSRDGRDNLMYTPDVTEFYADVASAQLTQNGLVLSDRSGYFDGGTPGFEWAGLPHRSMSIEKHAPLLATVNRRAPSDDVEMMALMAATL